MDEGDFQKNDALSEKEHGADNVDELKTYKFLGSAGKGRDQRTAKERNENG